MPDFRSRFGQQRDDGTYYFSNVRSGLIVGLLSIGTLIGMALERILVQLTLRSRLGALVGGPLSDVLGRRISIAAWSLVFCVGNIVQIAATDKWYEVMMGRFVMGLGVGGLSLLVPMYMAVSLVPCCCSRILREGNQESGPRHIRGALISCYQLFITLGIFTAA